MPDEPKKSMEQVIRDDGRYPMEAFEFLHEGLSRAVGQVYGDKAAQPASDPNQKHVSGSQLCNALREEAVARWGLLAQTVLNQWNIHATIDFGNMVYLLIRHSFMRKTEGDSLEDFRDVYEFPAAFNGEEGFDLKE